MGPNVTDDRKALVKRTRALLEYAEALGYTGFADGLRNAANGLEVADARIEELESERTSNYVLGWVEGQKNGRALAIAAGATPPPETKP